MQPASRSLTRKAEPKDHRLFHYKECLEHFRDALTNGLWPRYCVEEFDWLLGHFTCMAFPVVCFCDIPIPAASSHRERYGHYALAIHKESAGGYDINPVWYIQEDSSVEEHLATILEHPGRVTLDTIPPAIKPLLPFLKSTIGAQPDRQAIRSGTLEILPFEEELEWRHSPSSLAHTWKFGYARNIVTAADHQDSVGRRLVLSHDDIESVYVPTQADADTLIAEFPTLLIRYHDSTSNQPSITVRTMRFHSAGLIAGKIQLWPH
jgi:hypothetical protein